MAIVMSRKLPTTVDDPLLPGLEDSRVEELGQREYSALGYGVFSSRILVMLVLAVLLAMSVRLEAIDARHADLRDLNEAQRQIDVLRVPVLYWHRLDDFQKPTYNYDKVDFMTQVRWLASRGYETITPDQLRDWLDHGIHLPPKPVIFQFDDNYGCVYRVADPLLGSLGMCGWNGVITKNVGTWNQCSWEQIRAMFAKRVVYPVSHTWSHCYHWTEDHKTRLPHLTDEQQEWELLWSKTDIEANVPGWSCVDLIYPGGAYNATTHEKMDATGYLTGFRTDTMTSGDLNHIYRDTPRKTLRRLYMASDLSHAYGTLEWMAESKLMIPLSTPTAQPTDGDRLVDNEDAEFDVTGSWLTGSSGGGYYGANYRYIAAGSGATATWNASVPVAGIYDVYMSIPTRPGNTKHAVVEVTHVGGTTELLVNMQTANQGDWVRIMRCFLGPDSGLQVRVCQNADAEVVADAVFVRMVEKFLARVDAVAGTVKLSWPSLPTVDHLLEASGPDGVWSALANVPGRVGRGELTIPGGLSRRHRFRVTAQAPVP